MLQTVLAQIDSDGQIRLLEKIKLTKSRKALVTVLDEDIETIPESLLFSEAALAKDWNRSEEDEAWEYLQ
jgi:hypothetical protein